MFPSCRKQQSSRPAAADLSRWFRYASKLTHSRESLKRASGVWLLNSADGWLFVANEYLRSSSLLTAAVRAALSAGRG